MVLIRQFHLLSPSSCGINSEVGVWSRHFSLGCCSPLCLHLSTFDKSKVRGSWCWEIESKNMHDLPKKSRSLQFMLKLLKHIFHGNLWNSLDIFGGTYPETICHRGIRPWRWLWFSDVCRPFLPCQLNGRLVSRVGLVEQRAVMRCHEFGDHGWWW